MASKRWTTLALATAAVAVAVSACNNSSSGPQTRTVLVDFGHDEFAGAFLAYYPKTTTFRPGDTVDFRQVWNGEPHSVTMGTLVEDGLTKAAPLIKQYPHGEGAPPEVTAQFDEIFKNLPFMFGNGPDAINQAAAQPCFLDSGSPPTDPKTACPHRTQPAFNGRQPYYSSGFIPYAGNQGNKFEVKLADDIKPGTYQFYCDLHGPDMSGSIVVKPKGTAIPSQSAVSRQARKEVDTSVASTLKAFRTSSTPPFSLLKAARAAGFLGPNDPAPPGTEKMYAAGYATTNGPGFISEFIPRTINAKVGEKVTWAFIGQHTVSFGVPHYFPQLTIAKDGTVKTDHRGTDAAGGAGMPEKLPDNPPNPFVVDGGKWGGSGLHSSGLPNDTGGPNQIVGYSLTFTKAGTYDYACLIHPRMVAKVVVSG